MRVAPSASVVIHGWTLYAHPLFLVQVETLTDVVEGLKARDPAGYTAKNATKRLFAITRLAFDLIGPFFRYHASSRIIVYAWVNDEDTKRAYESGDAYRVFRRMLGTGHPPDSWDTLLTEAGAESAQLQRLARGCGP